jgi:hypothetical protein
MSSITTEYIDPATGKKVKPQHAVGTANTYSPTDSIIAAAYGTPTPTQTAATPAAPLSGTDYINAGREAAMSAARQRTDATLAAYEAQKPVIAEQYADVAKQAYQGYRTGGEALANQLASQGLYNSGYADTNRVRYNTSYREAQNTNQLAKAAAMRDLENQILVARATGAANLSDLEAQYNSLLASQANTDRAYAYQQGRDKISDQQYAAAQAYQREQDALAAQQYNEAFAYQQSRDAVSDQQYQQNFTYQQQRAALDAAYRAAEMGDFTKLEALGIDPAPYKAYYNSQLAAGTKANEAAASAQTLDSVTLAQAQNDAYNFVRAQASQPGATYTDIVNQLDRNRDYGIKTWGEARWNAYAEAALAAAYQYFYPPAAEPLRSYDDYYKSGIDAFTRKDAMGAALANEPSASKILDYVAATTLSYADMEKLAYHLAASLGISRTDIDAEMDRYLR